MTIVVRQRPLEETRSRNKSCEWIAEAIVNGKTYSAISRTAPANDIARQLVHEGVPDDEMRIFTLRLSGCMQRRSFHEAAARTCRESETTPVKSVGWMDPAAVRARLLGSNAPNVHANPPAGTSVPPAHSAPHSAAFDVVG